MTEKFDENGIIIDEPLTYESMMAKWEEAEKFDKDGYGDLAFTLKSIFFNNLDTIKDERLVRKINVTIHPWMKREGE